MAAADRCREQEPEELAVSAKSQVAASGNGDEERERERELLATADGNAGASCCGERAYCDRHERQRTAREQSVKRRRETSRVAGQTTTTTEGAGVSLQDDESPSLPVASSPRPLILITEPAPRERGPESASGESLESPTPSSSSSSEADCRKMEEDTESLGDESATKKQDAPSKPEVAGADAGDQFEVIDGISYRIVAAVTRKPTPAAAATRDGSSQRRRQSLHTAAVGRGGTGPGATAPKSRFSSVRRKSSAFVANLLHSGQSFLVPQSRSSNALSADQTSQAQQQVAKPRRMSIYEMTKTPPPETSIEMYLNERRRSSTVSAKFVAQQLEQQSTFETNYCARQQYFKDLNAKLINQDKKLLNVVANRGQIHRHSVDIAQLPLFLATQSSARTSSKEALDSAATGAEVLREEDEEQLQHQPVQAPPPDGQPDNGLNYNYNYKHPLSGSINQVPSQEEQDSQPTGAGAAKQRLATTKHLAAISEDRTAAAATAAANEHDDDDGDEDDENQRQRDSLGQLALVGGGPRRTLTGGQIVRRFQKFDSTALSSAPSPDVKIGQRVAYKEYYGNEFGTIRWIGRVPQISPDWTVGVEFDNAIGEGDGSLNGRRYFIAKDCFAKFLALSSVTLVDQHVGRPEPGTMISVMSAAVRPGQMISIQRVSTVHVQHCFLNAPHRRPGAEFLAVNTRLHCQCPNCGPCAHVVKPPRTQRLVTPKNATHMCQFSTYTCCGMESSDEALCTYTGNKISSLPPPPMTYATGGSLPPLGNSWMDGSGYLSQLQAEQRKLMPEEYRLGAAPEDAFSHAALPRRGSSGKRRAGQQNSMPSDAQSPASCDSRARDTAMSASLNAEVNKHHNHRHKHHHHHHHHHKQRHKSPVTTGQTTGEEQVVGVAPKQQPVYVNLSGDGQPGALIDMHDDDEYNEKVNPETSALDDDEPAAARLSGNGHSGRQTSGSNRYDDDDDNQEPSEDEDRRLDRALRAVQYRDSIENRYLFPTDDIIDSLLEADLETLSQARYGSAGRRNERSRGRSSASSSTSVGVRRLGRGRGARDKNRTKLGGKRYRARSSSDVASGHSDGRPNPILQRLRSLVVSCMSAAGDGNATAAVASSSKSNHQAAYTTLGRADSRAQQQLASSRLGANSQGSSRPLSAWRDPDADADCCHCRHQQASRASACSTAFAQQTTITNEIITTTNGALAFADELDHGHGPATVPEQANKASPALLGPDHDHDPRLASNHLYSNDPNLDPFECDKPASHQFRAEPRRQKLICSHAAAGRRARGASGARRPAPSSRACRHAKQRHASSSSDCGFSSASQNSINVSQHTSGAQQQQQPPRSRLDDLEKRAIDDLYQKLASRLANHLSAAGQKGQTNDEFSHDELLKLKAALLEMHSETCCLHQGSAGGTSSDSPLSAGQEFKEGEGKLTGGGSAQDCALPRAFKLKLSLSINPETTIAPQGD